MGLTKKEGFLLSIWLILLAPVAGIILLIDFFKKKFKKK